MQTTPGFDRFIMTSIEITLLLHRLRNAKPGREMSINFVSLYLVRYFERDFVYGVAFSKKCRNSFILAMFLTRVSTVFQNNVRNISRGYSLHHFEEKVLMNVGQQMVTYQNARC